MTKVEKVQFPPEELEAIQHSYACWKRLHWCRSKVNSAFEIASLMAMFSLIATVEIPMPQGKKEANPNLVIAFVSTSSSLVAVTVIVKVISSHVLLHLDTMAEMSVSDSERSLHDNIISWISLTCILGHTIAPILFCVDIILVSWIKFPKFAELAPFAVTFIIFPIIVLIIRFGVEFSAQMKQFKDTSALNFPVSIRYVEIGDRWEVESSGEISSDFHEQDHLLKSVRSVTSYGAIVQSEYIGSPSSIFADIV